MRKTPAYSDEVEKKLCYRFVFKNRVAFAAYWMPQAWGSGLRYWNRYYQYPPLLLEDSRGLFGGRSFGKSVTEEILVDHGAFDFPWGTQLVTAFRSLHVRLRLEGVIDHFLRIPYWFQFLDRKRGRDAIRRTPSYEVRVKPGHTLYGISIGDDPQAVNIKGGHHRAILIEEGQDYPDYAWKELHAAQDPEHGASLFISGTVDGRTDTPFRKADSVEADFKDRRIHVPRYSEPFFTQRTKTNCATRYEGVNTDLYAQQVESNWGAPVSAVWNLQHILRNMAYDTTGMGRPRRILQHYIWTPEDLNDVMVDGLLDQLPQIPKDADVIIAADPAYTSDTCILPFYRTAGSKWRLDVWVDFKNKPHPDQIEALLEGLLNHYNERAVLAIDTTSADGRTPALRLRDKYGDRIVMAAFNEAMVIGTEIDKETQKEKDVKVRPKNWTTVQLKAKFGREEFDIAWDEEFYSTFNREQKKPSATLGYTIKTPADVHVPDAMRVFEVAWHTYHGILFEYGERKPNNNWADWFPEADDIGIVSALRTTENYGSFGELRDVIGSRR